MSVSKDQYTGSNMRTLDKVKMCEKPKGVESKKECVRPSPIEIEPKDCVVDELHLFLRITDILFNNVFARLHALDLKSKLHGMTMSVKRLTKSGKWVSPLVCGSLKKVTGGNPDLDCN